MSYNIEKLGLPRKRGKGKPLFLAIFNLLLRRVKIPNGRAKGGVSPAVAVIVIIILLAIIVEFISIF